MMSLCRSQQSQETLLKRQKITLEIARPEGEESWLALSSLNYN